MAERIFLTGGTGFFGKSILDMHRRGFCPETEWTILSRRPEKFLAENPEFANLPGVCFLAGDVKNFTFPSGSFDLVIHAATPAVTSLAPGEMSSVILAGTERTLEFARQCGAEKFLFISSGAVYGIQPPELERIPEDFPCCPVTEYGIAKYQAELRCLKADFPVYLARCFAFAGPYLNRDIHFAIGNFVRDALANSPIVIQGDGTPFRSYLYADDLVRWLFGIVEKGKPGVPYNVGSDEAVSIAELARCVSRVLGSSGAVEIRKTPIPGVPASRYVPDISRCRALGLALTVPLAEAIRKMALRSPDLP